MVRRPRWDLLVFGVYMGQLRGSCVADCSLGCQGGKRACGGLGIGIFGASVSGKEQVNFVVEFSKQHIDCVQHLHLQSKCGSET